LIILLLLVDIYKRDISLLVRDGGKGSRIEICWFFEDSRNFYFSEI